MAAVSAADPGPDDWSWCLAWQQPAAGVDDDVAERCTWTLMDHRRLHRTWLAGTGRLVDWMEEYHDDRVAALARYPELHASYPEYDAHAGSPPLLFDSRWMEGRGRPIDVAAAERMLTQVLLEETRAGLPPRPGAPTHWSADFRREHPFPHWSRLLATLAGGNSSRFLRTGREEALLDWLGRQPEGSVTVEAMFRECYELAGGDVYLALLTAENVLSRYFQDPRRDDLAFLRRLRPISDTFEDRGDRFGAWYHLFGTMVYTFSRGSLAGHVAAAAETFGSRWSNVRGEVELQEAWINRSGATLGAHLRREVGRWDPAVRPDEPDALVEDAYMDLDEFGWSLAPEPEPRPRAPADGHASLP